jgi:hypothetical protein
MAALRGSGHKRGQRSIFYKNCLWGLQNLPIRVILEIPIESEVFDNEKRLQVDRI